MGGEPRADSGVTGVFASHNGGVGINTDPISVITGCAVYNNGSTGTSTGTGSTISDCIVYSNAGHGIHAGNANIVSRCTARENTMNGLYIGNGSTVTDCTARENLLNGIFLLSTNSIVRSSTAYANFQIGIQAISASTIANCVATNNGFDGIRVVFDCRVTDNNCSNNGSAGLFAGIFANGNRNRIEGNHCTSDSGNDGGIRVLSTGVGNLVIGNYAGGGGVNNYVVPGTGNFIGTIHTSSAGMNAAAYSNINISY